MDKKERFDPKTLKPFDKVLTRDGDNNFWRCNLFSHYHDCEYIRKFVCVHGIYKYCIPYNDDTKHLVDTMEEAPEYYRY